MKSGKITSRKGLKICCGITANFSTTLAVVLTTLWFTILKPHEPEITAHPFGLENIKPSPTLPIANVTVDIVITIDNHRNVGGFKFKNATGHVTYHGDVVADVPIGKNMVPARGKLNINTSADLMVIKIIANPAFFDDVIARSLNLTSTATLHGKVSFFKFVKLRATAFSTCDISFLIVSSQVHSKCNSKINL